MHTHITTTTTNLTHTSSPHLLLDAARPVHFQEQPDGSLTLADATLVPVVGYDKASTRVAIAAAMRATAGTALNSTSSRSHALFFVYLKRCVRGRGVCDLGFWICF